MENIEYKLVDNEVRRFFEIVSDIDGRMIASGDIGIDNEELLEVYNNNQELALQDYRIDSVLNPPEPETEPLTEAEQLQIETYLNTAFIADMMALEM